MIKFFADPLLRDNLKKLGYRGRPAWFRVDDDELFAELDHAAEQHPEEKAFDVQARAWARIIYRNWHCPKNAPIQPREVRLFAIAVLVLLVLMLFSGRAHAQIDNAQWQNGGSIIKTWGGGMLRINCGTNLTCTWDAANFRVNMSASGGAGSGTVTNFSAGDLTPLFTTTEATTTTTPALTFVMSNAAAHSFFGNCTGGSTTPSYCQPKTTDLADFNATAPTTSGKIPIWDQPSQTYIPGDPLVQGLVGDGSTTAANPVAVGGYDTAGTPALHRNTLLNSNPAGTEYGVVTRNIPGTAAQPVSIASMPSTPVTGPLTDTQLRATAVPVSGPLTDTQLRATPVPVSGTVTASGPLTDTQLRASAVPVSAASLPLPTGAAQDATLTGGTVKVKITGNTGATVDAAPGAALPTNALQIAGRDSTQTGGGSGVPIVCDKSAAITATAVGSVVVIPLAASKTTHVCGFVITGAGAAGTMQWKSGTGTTCGTSTSNLTGAMATAIGGTVSFGSGLGQVFQTAASAQDTCVTMATTSATAAGIVTYAQF